MKNTILGEVKYKFWHNKAMQLPLLFVIIGLAMNSFKYLSIFKEVLMSIETPTRKTPRRSTDDILEGKRGINEQAMKVQQFMSKYWETCITENMGKVKVRATDLCRLLRNNGQALRCC